MNTKNKSSIVSPQELLFFKNNWLVGLPSLVAEALRSEGISVSRQKVHKELTTLKDEYDSHIISKAHEIIEVVKGVKFNPDKT